MIKEISNKEYRDHIGISSSQIKRMAKSMALFHYMEENPSDGDGPALLMGRAVHKMCLEPYDFDNEFIVAPKVDKRTKDGKQAWNEFLEKAGYKDVIDSEQYQIICDMKEALYATPFCKKLLYGEHEKSIFWHDEKLDVDCKVRPDSYGKMGNHIVCVDLKTCASAETESFMKDAIKFGYDIQAAYYLDGLRAEFGEKYEYDFVFIAIEKNPPYLVNILQADEYFIKSGEDTKNELLTLYKKCIEKDEWPGYLGFNEDVKIGEISLPNWMKKMYEGEEK